MLETKQPGAKQAISLSAFVVTFSNLFSIIKQNHFLSLFFINSFLSKSTSKFCALRPDKLAERSFL